MKVTNNYNYPDSIYQAIVQGIRPPEPGVLHVTELVDPPQIVALKHTRWEELVIDVSQLAKSFVGTQMHKVLQHTMLPQGYQEHTMVMEVVDGWKVSGTSDLIIPENGGHWIKDYKFTSAWTFVFNPGGRDEWSWQTNCYAELARREGIQVDGLEVIAWMPDWKEYEALRNRDYPQNNILTFEQELLPSEVVHNWIIERVAIHKQAIEGGTWAPCSAEDRWQRSGLWKVKKEGGKIAVKGGAFENEQEAVSFLAEKGEGYEIEHIPGKHIRCESWCEARSVCPQWASLKSENLT